MPVHISLKVSQIIFFKNTSIVSDVCGLGKPNDWREALQLYDTLLQYAYNEST